MHPPDWCACNYRLLRAKLRLQRRTRFQGRGRPQEARDAALKNKHFCSFQVDRRSCDADKTLHRLFAEPGVDQRESRSLLQGSGAGQGMGIRCAPAGGTGMERTIPNLRKRFLEPLLQEDERFKST